MKQTYLCLMFMLWATLAVAQDPFITTWEVTTNSPGITIPTTGEGYNYTVDFGDGTVLTNQTGDSSHTYSEAGIYTVSISGDFPRVYFESGGGGKIKSVEQWGDIEWTSMEYAFSGCYKLVVNATDVPDLTQVTSMQNIFFGCSVLNQPLNNWDVSNVTNMNSAFYGADKFNQPLDSWDVSNVTTMEGMFTSANEFNQPLDAWDVSNVTNMDFMFDSAFDFNQPLDGWDVSSVTTMESMFHGAQSFNQPLNSWDVSNVTNMFRMFWSTDAFNGALNNWDVLNVTDMGSMFHGAQSFNQPLNSWDVSSVSNMREMFRHAVSFNQPLNNWDVSNVTNMYKMFQQAYSFNGSLNDWDVSNGPNVRDMFYYAYGFNQPLNDWDVSNVTNMNNMFNLATSFNQSLDNWDTSSVTTMVDMFKSASNFNQTLNSWNFENISPNGFQDFLAGSGLSVTNYDLLLEHFTESNLTIWTFGANQLQYCNEDAHNYLTDILGWYIEWDSLAEACNSISGTVLYDSDTNGCTETDILTDVFFVNLDNDTNTYTQSIKDGNFNIATIEESFTVSLANVPDYLTVSPESIVVDFATTPDEQVDFCITSNQDVNDLNITLLPTGQARPGFEATYKLVVKNLGTQSMDNITASLLFDEAMQSFVEANPVTSATTTSSLEFAIATLAPFESWETSVTMQTFTPPTVNGGDLLNFTATVLPNTDDYTPNDNTFSLEQIVVNSYDPNDKQVLQGETIVMEQTGEYLDFLIRFQNTGSASAVNIRVEDVLHENLDWSTLSITSASHDYEVQITNGNEVDFVFNGIYLPAESQNEPESHGFIAYKIKPKTTVQVGDIMSGNASIYFDYNEPIITNTVTTEVVDVLGVDEYNLASFITVYPNPINEGIHLEMTDGVELISAKLYNVQGRLLLETKETINYIKTEQLSSGVYMLRLETNKGQLVKRVVKK